MADAVIPKSVPCRFEIAWRGACGKPSADGWCYQHESMKCQACRGHATHTCDYIKHFASTKSAVCGVALCGSCHHEPYIPGEVTLPQKHLNAEEYKVALARARAAR